jgi:hypothetical protein
MSENDPAIFVDNFSCHVFVWILPIVSNFMIGLEQEYFPHLQCLSSVRKTENIGEMMWMSAQDYGVWIVLILIILF